MKEKDFHRKLIKRYLEGTATDDELEVFFHLVEQHIIEPELEREVDELYAKIVMEQHVVPTKLVRLKKWLPVRRLIQYAAVVLVALAIGSLILEIKQDATETADVVADIAPGGNKAVLKFADGRTIDLSSEQTGIIIGDANVTYNDGATSVATLPDVTMLGDRELASESEMLALITPKGGTYQVTLPDGTKVWLNAASTLTYPSRFAEEERVVFLEGEAYFSVIPMRKEAALFDIPFRVVSKGQTVEVLGTEFNISAYPEDSENKTTLVEGSVKVTLLNPSSHSEAGSSNILAPGQQSTKSGSALALHSVDTDTYTAWKDGYFNFDGLTPGAAFTQLERWYDIDVVYQGKVPAMRFFGMFKRDKELSSVLGMLRESGLDFKITQQGGQRQLLVINE